MMKELRGWESCQTGMTPNKGEKEGKRKVRWIVTSQREVPGKSSSALRVLELKLPYKRIVSPPGRGLPEYVCFTE
jgi:hypothetical protein